METGFVLIGLSLLILVWKIEDIIRLLKDCNNQSDNTNKDRNLKNKNKKIEG